MNPGNPHATTALSPTVTRPLASSGISSSGDHNCLLRCCPILQLVEQAHFDGTFEGSLQIDIIVSSHQIDEHRHMSAFSISIPIGIHTEAHLVPSKVRVYRITVPRFIILLLLLKPCHLHNPWRLLLKELVHQPGLLIKGIRHTTLCTQLTDQISQLQN